MFIFPSRYTWLCANSMSMCAWTLYLQSSWHQEYLTDHATRLHAHVKKSGYRVWSTREKYARVPCVLLDRIHWVDIDMGAPNASHRCKYRHMIRMGDDLLAWERRRGGVSSHGEYSEHGEHGVAHVPGSLHTLYFGQAWASLW
jgi:hypothetical protein